MLQSQGLASKLFWGEFKTLVAVVAPQSHRAMLWCESVTVHHVQRFVDYKYRDGCLRWNSRIVNLSGSSVKATLSLRAWCHLRWKKRGKLPVPLGYSEAKRMKESSTPALISHWRLEQSSHCQSTCSLKWKLYIYNPLQISRRVKCTHSNYKAKLNVKLLLMGHSQWNSIAIKG